MADVTPVAHGRSSNGGDASSAKRRAEDAADASLLRDRVTAAFGDQYLIEEEVGRGGMAVVYAAEDVRLQRRVALKVLPPDLAFRSDVRERFVREAQTAARLNHPHIVPIYAVHENAGMVCFAMALVIGETLAEFIAKPTRPTFAMIANVLEQVADALAYAHASGVVHRDIKPDNVLLDRESGRAMVTDFGIARAAETGARLTQTGVAVGTPAFMSPEQATGDKDVDGRSDVYSLGVVGYLLLAGRLPFAAPTTPAMLVAHVSETPPPIWSLRPDAPRSLVDILERCLAKKPGDRWASAQAMRDALRHVQRDGSLAIAPSPRSARYEQHEAISPMRAAQNSAHEQVQREIERAKRSAADYADRYGHRAEDWNPRATYEPQYDSRSAAPQQLQPWVPNIPAPPLPPLSPNASREEFREWRRAAKEQRRSLREHYKRDVLSQVTGAVYDADDQRPIEEQIARFRQSLISNGVLILFLGTINAVTSRQFPWVIFPAFGISMGVLAGWGKLSRRGVRWSQVFGESDAARDDAIDDALTSKPGRIANAVSSFRKRVGWLAGSAIAGAVSFAIGSGLSLDAMMVPFVGSILVGLASAQLSIVGAMRLRKLGVPLGDALGRDWHRLLSVPDERPRDVRMREELDRVAGPALLNSMFGDALRSAVDDRVTIRDASQRLSDADKVLVPDVEPTADALLERIGALASGLERLQRDLPGNALKELDGRIASVEREPESAPDHERRLSLLTRQRDSLLELVERRDTMQRQFESATMAMRSLRLDMVKLRTLGVGAAIGDVTNATQEARALSRDIGRAVEAADEVRRL